MSNSYVSIIQGGDTDCLCDDFSEPISREEFKGWLAAHEANKQRITQNTKYDVVFLGDETTEGWNGRWMNMPIPRESKQILNYWNKTFTKEGGGNLEGLALGIAGDSVRFREIQRVASASHGPTGCKLTCLLFCVCVCVSLSLSSNRPPTCFGDSNTVKHQCHSVPTFGGSWLAPTTWVAVVARKRQPSWEFFEQQKSFTTLIRTR